MSLDLAPQRIHKLPFGTECVLLCDNIIYLTLVGGKSIKVISSKLTETGMDQNKVLIFN